jgi:molybdate-binding protein/DNA-binding XRE family transcriptional regulator
LNEAFARSAIANHLGAVRRARGISAAELAQRARVSRQTIYAIEAGAYVPNTALALRLARELEVSVEELFSLQEERPSASAAEITAELLAACPPQPGEGVQLAQVHGRWVSIPALPAPYFLPEGDAIVQSVSGPRARLIGLAPLDIEGRDSPLVVAGCDPAAQVLAGAVARSGGVRLLAAPASSRRALRWLKQQKAHVAGCHLLDPKTGEANLPFLRQLFREQELLVVTLASWEEGLVVQAGNPKGVGGIEDLARRDIRFVNREVGSAMRALADRLLKQAGIPSAQVQGYGKTAPGHLPAAYCVLAGEADVCLATRAAARFFHLSFIPLQSVRYDLVMHRESMQLAGVRVLLDVLQQAVFRRKLEQLASYDTSLTGKIQMHS